MAQNIEIGGVSYSAVPAVDIPKSGGGTARFIDTSDATVIPSEMMLGKTAYVNGVKITGTAPEKDYRDVYLDFQLEQPRCMVPPGLYKIGSGTLVPVTNFEPKLTLSGAGAAVLGDTSSSYPVSFSVEHDTSDAGAFEQGWIYDAPPVQGGTKYIKVEEKTVTPTTSAQDITPTAGKLMSGVHVNAVNVSATADEDVVLSGYTFFANDLTQKTGTLVIPEPSLQSKTATANGTVTPDSGYDGLSSVTVAIPYYEGW